ncbi:MAG TPA: NF038122 family metalloprotease, partial [Pyrinomonadaceae bacterium]
TTVFVATPILRALGAIDSAADPPNESNFGPVPKIAFNSGFGFDFNPNDGITGNRTDFDAVAVHEIGHALGFDSAVGEQELVPPGTPVTANLWDLFRVRPGTANLGNFGTVQRILSTGGTQVQFNGGPAELGLSTGNPQGNNGDGEQASHWKDDALNGGFFIGIMDPNIPRNRREVLQPNDENAIDSFGYTIQATPAPPNDNFADSAHLSGASGTIAGTNAGATKEPGEPIEPQTSPLRPGGRSVWYDWTAIGTGQATIDTNGSNFDTTLAVYTGNVLTALTVIASNDDVDPVGAPPPRNLTSRVVFNATAGTTYRIQVDGFLATDTGNISLQWNGPAAPTPTPTPTPGPNTVQFTASTASATEAPNTTVHVDLLVTRTGSTTAAASVNYTTSNATASDRSDYEAAAGTLQFAANEMSKTIPVFIVNDAFGEGPETFNVSLSNPVFCTLGSPINVTVTINSDEAVNGTNAVKDATFNSDFFLRQHYLDFFNREADAGGLAFWKNQIDECETRPPAEQQACRDIRRINVSAAFFLSIEFQQTGYLVERLYKVAYGDGVGTSTLNGTHQLAVPIVRLNEFLPDTQQIGRGVVIGQPGAEQLLESNKQALIAEFVQRSRFLTKYPLAMSPGAFVNELAANTGSGIVSPDERNQLISDLTTGAKTRADVLRAIAEDSDLFAGERNRAFVLAQFFGYLRRNPNDAPEAGLDYTGYDFWLGKLNQFSGNFVNAEMVKAFIISGEYQGRFGP